MARSATNTKTRRTGKKAKPAGRARKSRVRTQKDAHTNRHPTRIKIVQAAMKLFYENGYHATGNADVLSEAGANSGSMYYFFTTKQDLLLAVLDTYAEMMQGEVFEPAFAQTRNPIKRVMAVMAGYRMLLESTQCERGCPIGNLALEVDDMPEVREKIAMNFDNWCAVVESCFRQAKHRFPRGTDFAALSRFVLTAMEGGIMQARAYRSLEPFDACIDRLADYIKRLMKAKQA